MRAGEGEVRGGGEAQTPPGEIRGRGYAGVIVAPPPGPPTRPFMFQGLMVDKEERWSRTWSPWPCALERAGRRGTGRQRPRVSEEPGEGPHDGRGGGRHRLWHPRTPPRAHASAVGQSRESRVRHNLTRVLPWSAAGSLSAGPVTGRRRRPHDPLRRLAQQVLGAEQPAPV